jgi:hypothetical protein
LFEIKIAEHWFVKPHHLDLDDDFLNSSLYPLIKKKILSIQKLKTPKAKIVRIVNVCKLISGMISEFAQNIQNSHGN